MGPEVGMVRYGVLYGETKAKSEGDSPSGGLFRASTVMPHEAWERLASCAWIHDSIVCYSVFIIAKLFAKRDLIRKSETDMSSECRSLIEM